MIGNRDNQTKRRTKKIDLSFEKNVIMLYAKYDTECGFDKFPHYVSSEFS